MSNDIDVVIAAINNDGKLSLELVADKFKENYDVVLAAVE